MSGIIKSILEIKDIKAIKPNFDEIKILDRETCEKTQVIIFDKELNTLKLLTTNNLPEEVSKIKHMLEQKWFRVDVSFTSVEWFKEAMKRYDDFEHDKKIRADELEHEKVASWKWALSLIWDLFEKRDSHEPGEFIMEIIRLAFQSWASDLHFQPQNDWILMRVRIDWVMQELQKFTHQDFMKYLQKIKFISWVKMNIDYVPQDWRFSFVATNRDGVEKTVDARVSFMPWVKEESTVIRFLDPSQGISTFEDIWFVGKSYDTLIKSLEKNTWITIFTWPTWSWKTTTLYTILNYLNDWKEKIITLEDPIEYQLPWIQQSQINYAKWYDYAEWLKAILRHDPDIILVWETRDIETAEISVNAALTWHKVFTTLHTNSAIESITRLVNMWLKPYMIAPSLNIIVAQRLVRRLCPHCATKREWNFWEKAEIQDALNKIKDVYPAINANFDWMVNQAVWCDHCWWTWYKWRFAIIETFEITENIKKLIVEWKLWVDLYMEARENWYLTLKEDWILKMLEWKTTLDELRRVL